MTWMEIATIVVVVGASVGFVIKTLLASGKGDKGSCKACGPSCACAPEGAEKESDRAPKT